MTLATPVQTAEPSLWMMRDNHTFLRLPIHAGEAMDAIRADQWQYGMLCYGDFHRKGPVLHMRGGEFPEQDVLEWLIEAVDAALRGAVQPAEARPEPPYGCVTTHSKTGQQFFYRYPDPPYLDNASECVDVYTRKPAPTKPEPDGSPATQGASNDDESDSGRARRLAGEGDDDQPQHGRNTGRRVVNDSSSEHEAGLLRPLDGGTTRQGDADDLDPPACPYCGAMAGACADSGDWA